VSFTTSPVRVEHRGVQLLQVVFNASSNEPHLCVHNKYSRNVPHVRSSQHPFRAAFAPTATLLPKKPLCRSHLHLPLHVLTSKVEDCLQWRRGQEVAAAILALDGSSTVAIEHCMGLISSLLLLLQCTQNHDHHFEKPISRRRSSIDQRLHICMPDWSLRLNVDRPWCRDLTESILTSNFELQLSRFQVGIIRHLDCPHTHAAPTRRTCPGALWARLRSPNRSIVKFEGRKGKHHCRRPPILIQIYWSVHGSCCLLCDAYAHTDTRAHTHISHLHLALS
jgi:hypothetical protein